MNFSTLIKTSLMSLKANKLRTGLTVLGIVIGIAAIIIVFSAGAAIEELILSEVQSFGSDIIETEIKIPTDKKGLAGEQQSAASLVTGAQVTTLTLKDMKDINKLPNIEEGYSGVMNQKQVSYLNERKKIFLLGTNASYTRVDKSEVDKGRFFTENENESLAEVAVIGNKVKKDLFGPSRAIGEKISIGNSKFKIIGVMKERGSVLTLNFDEYIYIPVKTLQKKMMGIDYVVYMVHKVNNMEKANKTADKIRAILRDNHNIKPEYNEETGKVETNRDDFRVITMQEMMDMLNIITEALTFLLLAIVAISLVVGGVGIMNIMYVIVNERTGEIGLRKSVGAQKKDILIQFLIESSLITVLGGILGILVGIGASYLIYWGANSFGVDWSFVIPLKAYFTALVFSLVFGIIFGLYPAQKAANLDPITALRLE